MVCLPWSLRTHQTSAKYKRSLEGPGDDYCAQKRCRTLCPECNKDLSEGSLPSHLRTQHKSELHGNTGDAPVTLELTAYTVTFPAAVVGMKQCPVVGCPYVATSANLL